MSELAHGALRTLRPVRRWRVARLDAYLQELRNAAEVGLHLGCGPTYLEGLTNADAFDDSVRDRALDALDLDGYSDASVDHIETHHMFEHLSFADGRTALREWARVLKVGGTLAITVPDMDRVVRLWRWAGQTGRYEWEGSPVAEMIFGSQEHDGMFHRSGYNRSRLEHEMQVAGFGVVKSASPYPLRPTPSMLVVGRRSAS